MADFSIEPLSEDALLLRFGAGIDVGINARVQAAARALRERRLQGVTEIAPAYASLLIRFDPFTCNSDTFREAIAKTLELGLRRGDAEKGSTSPHSARQRSNPTGEITRTVEIPVCYGGEYGADLAAVAAHAHLDPVAVVARHTTTQYAVATLGFAPGFPYLLGLDPALQVPRRASPRTQVPAGSVAIGGAQTGIYPRELPGGWHLIGRTPLALFDCVRNPPCLLAPGDRVRFRAIDADEFTRLAEHHA